MERRLKKIFADVFLVDPNLIEDSTGKNSLDEWDSLGHLNLITSIEEEFQIIFTEEQIIEMLNFKLVCLITKEAIDQKDQLPQIIKNIIIDEVKFIKGNGIFLREPRYSDLDSNWYNWLNDQEVTKIQNKGIFPNTYNKHLEYFKNHFKKSKEKITTLCGKNRIMYFKLDEKYNLEEYDQIHVFGNSEGDREMINISTNKYFK